MAFRARVGALVLLTGLLVLSLPVLGQPQAAAAPADARRTCWSGYLWPNGAAAWCAGLAYGEKVRAVVRCDGPLWTEYERFGPWRSRDYQDSEIYCDDSGDDAVGHRYEVAIST